MKYCILFFALLCSDSLLAQNDSLPSAVYAWNNLKVEKTATGERRSIMEGSTTHLSYLEIHATTIDAGKAPHAPHQHPEEEFIIIKEGSLKVTIKDSSWILGPGSIAVMMPGDMHGFVNAGNTRATYYVIKSKSKAGPNDDRGKNAGGSFVINANDIPYKENPKGGKKQYFERPTTMMQRLEMHMTTLNESVRSHDPHTHVAEELMIVTSGNVDIQIGESHNKMAAGDLVLLNSGILHAPTNIGKGTCTYYAIQFQ
jgi:(S)-ureidoglycine aminohydrolase